MPRPDTMQFGRYKGRPWRDVPKGYWRWLWRHCDLYGRVREVAEAVLTGRPIPPPFAAGPREAGGEPEDPVDQTVETAKRWDEYGPRTT